MRDSHHFQRERILTLNEDSKLYSIINSSFITYLINRCCYKTFAFIESQILKFHNSKLKVLNLISLHEEEYLYYYRTIKELQMSNDKLLNDLELNIQKILNNKKRTNENLQDAIKIEPAKTINKQIKTNKKQIKIFEKSLKHEQSVIDRLNKRCERLDNIIQHLSETHTDMEVNEATFEIANSDVNLMLFTVLHNHEIFKLDEDFMENFANELNKFESYPNNNNKEDPSSIVETDQEMIEYLLRSNSPPEVKLEQLCS